MTEELQKKVDRAILYKILSWLFKYIRHLRFVRIGGGTFNN